MINGWMGTVLAGFQAINQILTAGIAITAFSLFLYSLSFNLRDRVARSFALILLCIVIIFTAESLQDNTVTIQTLDLLMRLQWFGLVFLPAAYLHLSDALLVTAGRPSRGRRRIAVRGMYILSSLFLALLAFGLLLGQIVPDGKPAPYLQRTVWTEVFTVFYVIAMVWAGINFYRAYSRMLTRSGRRRMIYLMAGATAPALGSYPYLLFGYALAAQHELAARQVEDGQIVTVSSRVGQVQLRLEVSETMMPGVVSIPHGWGHGRDGVQLQVAQQHAGVSLNDLTDEQQVDALTGNAAFNGVPVQVWGSAN